MTGNINESVFTVSVKDPERRLFDSLVYMPEGTSYNSYVVKGSKYSALIDCSDPDKEDEFIKNISPFKDKGIDYIVLLHAEQDHSGAIYRTMELFPDAKIVCTEKVKQLMQVHFQINDNMFEIKIQGDILDLGDRKLKFYPVPFAHWPDNTMVHLEPENILFSSDLFGSHNTSCDDTKEIEEGVYRSARSYYSEIMMPFRRNIAKHTKTARDLNPEIIAPSHGPIWYNPAEILDLYDKWTSDDVRPFVTIPYVSMHHSTKLAAEYIKERLSESGLEVNIRNLAEKPESLMIQTGELVYDLVDAAAIVFCFPTVLGGPHPAILYTAMTANAMSPKTPVMGMICSYGWASKAADTLNSVTGSFRGEKMPPIMIKGIPEEEDYRRLDEYANEIANLVFSRS